MLRERLTVDRAGIKVSEVAADVPLKDAVSVTEVFAPTALVARLKTALSEPCATVTVAGTGTAEGLLLLNATTIPPGGAISFRSTAVVS